MLIAQRNIDIGMFYIILSNQMKNFGIDNKILTPYTIPRICNLSKDLRFDELRKVLESYGYEMNAPRSGSSHYTFRKQECMPITIPKYEPIKKVYVEMVRQIVESEAKNDEDAE